VNLFDLDKPRDQAVPISDEQVEAARLKLMRIKAELTRRQYLEDPQRWAKERLGITIWSKQADIFCSVRDNRRTAVPSCHEVGKSFIAGLVVCWWVDCNAAGDAFVVTTAPTDAQVRAILWREIGRAHTLGGLPGRLNQTEWFRELRGKEELVAFGRKPADYNPTAFQGIHAPKVLVVVDEACGVRGLIWEAADSLIANDNSKILAIGNPDEPRTEFEEICTKGSGWTVISISAFDSPNFTGETGLPSRALDQLIGPTYVEEKRAKWAKDWVWNEDRTVCLPPIVNPETGERKDPTHTNPLWQSKILGKFPPVSSESGLIPWSWILAAQQRWDTASTKGRNELGVDVGAGGDASAICHMQGYRAQIIHEDRNPDTMHTAGEIVAKQRKTLAAVVKIDSVGIGKGVADRVKEVAATEKLPFETFAVNVGESPSESEPDEDGLTPDKLFVNLRAELYWNLRQRFERGTIALDPQDEDLAGELVELRYRRMSSGKIQIETKDQALARGVPSPNRAEALMLASADPKKLEQPGGVLAGKTVW
jgi:hypothetical protein